MQNASARRTGTRIYTVFAGIGLTGLMLAAVVGGWWYNAMRVPAVSIPEPKMPVPNAFDFYLAAGKALVNDKQIADAVGVQPKAVYSHAQKEALVQANLGVIKILHQGFAYPYQNPPVRSFDTLFPYFAQFRAVARLCSLQSQVRAENGLLLVTLALHVFRLEHGYYPASLAELTPGCLKTLPEDPFGKQGTFPYHVQRQHYLLYSVGPDGKDDGGKVIDDPKHAENPDSTSPNARYFVNQNSVGDVVAGKNLY